MDTKVFKRLDDHRLAAVRPRVMALQQRMVQDGTLTDVTGPEYDALLTELQQLIETAKIDYANNKGTDEPPRRSGTGSSAGTPTNQPRWTRGASHGTSPFSHRGGAQNKPAGKVQETLSRVARKLTKQDQDPQAADRTWCRRPLPLLKSKLKKVIRTRHV